MRMRRRPELARTMLLAAVAAAATLLLLAGTVQGAGESAVRAASRAWNSVFSDRPKAPTGDRMIVVLSSPSVGERVAAATRRPSAVREQQWAAEVEGFQQTLLASLRQRGIHVQRDFVYTRVLDGFSAVLDSRAVAELQRNPIVVGLYPVRTVYPAETSTAKVAAARPEISLAGFDGHGVRVALIDTGVDRTNADLRGRVSHGFDLVAGDRSADAEASPADASKLETHGTRMAGLLLQVAPGAQILPLRVLGWQKSDHGYAVVGRGDQLVAGLERAVDPNGDGATADALPVALAPVVEPFAAFGDSPEARAVAGASALGTLVVAPSGNDGDAGIGFGSVGAPGSAPDALSVGALDTRRDTLEAQAKLLVGGSTVLDEPARVLGATGTERGLSLQVTSLLGPSLAAPARASGVEAGGSRLGDFFDTRGISRVAGRAALVPADGASLARKAENAKSAGAAALLVYGTDLPAGGLDLPENSIPVLALPEATGTKAADGLRAGLQVVIALSKAFATANPGAGHVAAFSSGGLAYDGRVRPDLVAPGVGLETDDVGGGHATATGSSAAAAVTAGTAALLEQARPGLDAADLRSALVGSADPLGEGVTREGAARLDPAAAAAAALAVRPATLAFGRAAGKNWSEARTITVKNLSARALQVGFAFVADSSAEAPVSFTAEPARLNLGPGASAEVSLGITAPSGVGAGASGVLLAKAPGARPARIPWAVSERPPANAPLVGSVSLSNWELTPSNSAPTVLAFRVGRVVDAAGGDAVEPVSLLDLELWTPQGKRLGLLARLRDLLPGQYAFGLTGRDADGKILPPGLYVLRLRAQPADAEDGTPSSTAETVFRIKEHA